MKACNNYYCEMWDSNSNGGYCMLAKPTEIDCKENTKINDTDEIDIDEFDEIDEDEFEEAFNPEIPFEINYGYTFPDLDNGDEIIKIIQDGLANGFKFSTKGGNIIVEEI